MQRSACLGDLAVHGRTPISMSHGPISHKVFISSNLTNFFTKQRSAPLPLTSTRSATRKSCLTVPQYSSPRVRIYALGIFIRRLVDHPCKSIVRGLYLLEVLPAGSDAYCELPTGNSRFIAACLSLDAGRKREGSKTGHWQNQLHTAILNAISNQIAQNRVYRLESNTCMVWTHAGRQKVVGWHM